MPHLWFTACLAMALAAGLSLVDDLTPKVRVYRAAYLFLYSITSIVAGSWVMHFIEG